jgi:uncharacterized protein YndB with AHSA1/START domain
MLSVEATISVNASPSAAFRAFTAEFFEWWPKDYAYSGQLVENMELGSELGALCSEWGPHGFRIDFGRILEWRPAERMAFSWQISPDSRPEPDPDKASRVTVSFSAEGTGAVVKLTHTGFEAHGDEAEAYASEMGGELGWPLILDLYRSYLEGAA